jgi:hypothetical protein
MLNKILYRKQLFEQKHKQWSKTYYTENDYLSKNTNNGQQHTIQKTTTLYLSKNTNIGQQNTKQKTTI